MGLLFLIIGASVIVYLEVSKRRDFYLLNHGDRLMATISEECHTCRQRKTTELIGTPRKIIVSLHPANYKKETCKDTYK